MRTRHSFSTTNSFILHKKALISEIRRSAGGSSADVERALREMAKGYFGVKISADLKARLKRKSAYSFRHYAKKKRSKLKTRKYGKYALCVV